MRFSFKAFDLTSHIFFLFCTVNGTRYKIYFMDRLLIQSRKWLTACSSLPFIALINTITVSVKVSTAVLKHND